MRYLAILMMACSLNLAAQDAVSEVKKQAFGNPYNQANENFINLMNEMSSANRISLFLFEGWKDMEIRGKDSSWVVVDSANYHMAEDKVFFFNSGRFYQLYPERIDYVVIDGRKFINVNHVSGKNLEPAYFEVLEEGDYLLLQKHDVTRTVHNDNPMGLPAAKEVEVKHERQLFYMTSSGRRPELVPRKKRDLILSFRRNRADMAAYAGAHKLSPKRPEDVRALFAHYNDIVKQQ